ncbi:hypothetical protein AA0118_g12016 [Alternaria tenuissima]|jgi:hypothetical protein|nr:hypothetical protein AA0118_g12016 [Alternaria tenuissima]
MAPPSASVSEFRNLYLPEDNFFTPQDFDKIGLSYYGPVTNITYDWPNKEESFYGRYVDRRLHGSSSEVDKWGQFPHMSAYGGFSGIRGISDSSDMATPELSSCSTISPASPTKTPASSTVTTASSAMNIGYGGSEETRSELSKRRDRHRWPCELCDRSYIRQGDLRRHKRKQHYIGSQTTKHVQQEPEARDNRMAKSLQSTLGKAPLRETSSLPHSKDKAHPSSKYEAKLTDYQGHGNSDEVDKARVKPELHRQGSRMSNQCVGSDIYSRAMSSDNYSAFPGNPDMSSKKRHNPDDDASQCSGDFSSEEGDDSDGECDNVTTWNCSQFYALPFFLPYIRGHEGDTSSPCSDSPDSGSTTSGTTSDTPTSSTSGRTGGNGLQGNGYTSPSSGIGASNNSNHPILGIKDGMGPNFASDPQPLPLICWYSAAGKACTSKHVKMSIEVRHLWK